MTYETNYLAHHGILGQKWGVRRFQNPDGSLTPAGKKRYDYGEYGSKAKIKDMKEERSRLRNEYFDKDERKIKAIEYEKKAYDLADKYDFDADDGGGGRTKADRDAASRYMKYLDKSERMRDEIDIDAARKATDDMLAKYGSTNMKRLKNAETTETVATVVALTPVMVAAVPVAVVGSAVIGAGAIGYAAYSSAKTKRAEKKAEKEAKKEAEKKSEKE